MPKPDKLYASPSKMARLARKWFDICHRSPEFEDAPPLPLTPQKLPESCRRPSVFADNGCKSDKVSPSHLYTTSTSEAA